LIRRTSFALVAAVIVACCVVPSAIARPGASGNHNKAVCPAPAKSKTARCHARVVTDAAGQPLNSTSPHGGYGPGQLQAAYGLGGASATGGTGKTVVIVDAYDAPTALSDLNTYRSDEGLPALDGTPCTVSSTGVTSASGQPCFAKLNQSGSTGSYPAVDGGWAQEISLDVDMVSAICPRCNIAVVEASSNSYSNLFAAVDTARRLAPAAISNSYGGGEFTGETSYASHYDYPNVTVSSGDSGYGAEFPAALNVVTAVGGTSLNVGGSAGSYTRTGETAWKGAGSGCSGYVSQPGWQANAVGSLCTTRQGARRRAIADVSAVADPNTGVDVYDSTPDSTGAKGWFVFGGTSVASPIVASVYALAANSGPAWPYSHTGSLFDITSGSNGRCKNSAICTARVGWDGPTGMGTPHGVRAF
jgi:subtilase family serine protease